MLHSVIYLKRNAQPLSGTRTVTPVGTYFQKIMKIKNSSSKNSKSTTNTDIFDTTMKEILKGNSTICYFLKPLNYQVILQYLRQLK